jgi:hypothetical protein
MTTAPRLSGGPIGPTVGPDPDIGKLARLLVPLVVHVIGCRGEPATMRRAVTQQAPATTRRRRLPLEAHPVGKATPRGTTRTRTGWGVERHRRNAAPLDVVVELAVGPFIGPNTAVSGRIRPNPWHLRSQGFD